jgi:hypothetical protein
MGTMTDQQRGFIGDIFSSGKHLLSLINDILDLTAKPITGEERAKLNGYVTTIMEKAEFDRDRFTAEVRRAMSGRQSAA